ncbi:hypothetical protein HYFRA_00007534 [Hymenoscyphus fraxineus]|uniref:Metallo-beta-lactamase domain-containing protein n=1 Tax=Hymenoscyphus fraxineus TaxID=746836 RepID=A0A9N9PMW9_9HELO|nr:hypothetical protein HYFRA_00007534 [Hymenoscyphus fraxineus]
MSSSTSSTPGQHQDIYGTPTPRTSTISTPRPYNDYTIERFENPDFNIYNNSDTPPAGYTASPTFQLLICAACGTQYDTTDPSHLSNCRICDDPRQYVPPNGQHFTTLSTLLNTSPPYRNKWTPFPSDDRFWSLWTEPKFAIGQRAILIKTPLGNILWDCITFLDKQTTAWINSQGGLAAIIISHPHYYTTHLEWAEVFDCPVYLSWEDVSWLNRLDRLGKARCFIEGKSEEIEIRGQKSGVVALKLGGHFPGSLVCLAFKRLLVADTLLTTPAGVGDWSQSKSGGRPVGMNSYSFMWSIPNFIPLSPEEIEGMWERMKYYTFVSTHGAFVGQDINDGHGGSEKGVKQRVLESMQIQVRRMGWKEHSFLKETT